MGTLCFPCATLSADNNALHTETNTVQTMTDTLQQLIEEHTLPDQRYRTPWIDMRCLRLHIYEEGWMFFWLQCKSWNAVRETKYSTTVFDSFDG